MSVFTAQTRRALLDSAIEYPRPPEEPTQHPRSIVDIVPDLLCIARPDPGIDF